MRNEQIPNAVLRALARLEEAGYPAYLVGGCVRDLLRGEVPHDFDITTAALPEQTRRVFSDHRVLETGVQHGTVTVMYGDLPLEITTYRIDGSYSDGRHPDFVRFGDAIEQDLCRRDFTVNAMAWSPTRGLVDLFGGREDLQNGVIRCVGEPSVRFTEDALRILRGARFASCLDFRIDPETARAMREQMPLLCRVSSERIAAELVRLLCGKAADRILLTQRELIGYLLPELREGFDFDQHSVHHCYDVYTHTVKVVSGVSATPILRLAALFHDAAKPQVFVLQNGTGHFKGHPAQSALLCEKRMRALHMERAWIRDVCLLIRMHDFAIDAKPGDALALLQQVPKQLLQPLLELMRADANAKADPPKALQRIDALEEELNALLQKPLCLTVSDLQIDGDDLQRLGIPEGKRIGLLLRELLLQVQRGELENRSEVLQKEVEKRIHDTN